MILCGELRRMCQEAAVAYLQ